MGWLSGWFAKDVSDDTRHEEALRYTTSSRARIRKWTSQFVPWEMVADGFWDAVRVARIDSGRPPNVVDVLTDLLARRRQSWWDQGQLGSYRNDTLGLCKLAASQNDHEVCLSYALVVLTLDACGANNDGWRVDAGPFRSEQAFVSTGALLLFARSGRALGYDEQRLRSIFIDSAQQMLLPLGSKRPDVEPEALWKLVRVDLVREMKSRFTERGIPHGIPPDLEECSQKSDQVC